MKTGIDFTACSHDFASLCRIVRVTVFSLAIPSPGRVIASRFWILEPPVKLLRAIQASGGSGATFAIHAFYQSAFIRPTIFTIVGAPVSDLSVEATGAALCRVADIAANEVKRLSEPRRSLNGRDRPPAAMISLAASDVP